MDTLSQSDLLHWAHITITLLFQNQLCLIPWQHMQAGLSALTEYLSIMDDSAASMHSVKQHGMTQLSTKESQQGITAEQRMTWWRQRLALDSRMAALLCSVDDQWLGPWRYI